MPKKFTPQAIIDRECYGKTTKTRCKVYLPTIYRKYNNDVPLWALEMVNRYCTRPKCTLLWVSRSRKPSSGWANSSGTTLTEYGDREFLPGPIIKMQAGTDEVEAKWVLLHEIAHINRWSGYGHDEKFYKEAVRLYKKHGEGLLEVVARDSRYPTEKKVCEKALARRAASKGSKG